MKRCKYQLDNRTLWVIDEIYLLNKDKNYRKVIVEGVPGFYSKIPLKSNKKQLLIYHYCQEVIEIFFDSYKRKDIENALILGGSGCTVPYYLLHKYNNICVDIIEISSQAIEMAKRFFLNDYQNSKRVKFFNLDASKALGNLEDKYEYIYCDLFNGEHVCDFIMEINFVENLSRLVEDEGILIINIGKESILILQEFSNNLRLYFKHVYICYYNNSFIGITCNIDMVCMLTKENGFLGSIFISI